MSNINVFVKLLSHCNPNLLTASDAILLQSTENITILPKQKSLVPTGIKVKIPTDYEMQIHPIPKLASLGLVIPNRPGTIDQDYHGEIKVILLNLSTNPISILREDIIATMVVNQILQPKVRVYLNDDLIPQESRHFLNIQICNENFAIPNNAYSYSTPGSVGIDVCITNNLCAQNNIGTIATDLSINTDDLPVMPELRARSGLSLKYGLFLYDTPIIIKQDRVTNLRYLLYDDVPCSITTGDRVAQLVLSVSKNKTIFLVKSSQNATLKPYQIITIKTHIKNPNSQHSKLQILPYNKISHIALLDVPKNINYSNEIPLTLFNPTQDTQTISLSDIVAVAISKPCLHMTTTVVNELPESQRGERGFGSTGK